MLLLLILLTPRVKALDNTETYQCRIYGCQECNGDRLLCTAGYLKKFPNDPELPYTDVEISHQSFDNPYLVRKNLSKFYNVSKMKIMYTNLRFINSFTFKEQNEVKDLHLNNNRLGLIRSFAFFGLHLNNLYLDYNTELKIEKNTFNGLIVSILSISGCNLKSIDYETFSPVIGNLDALTLKSNLISEIDDRFEPAFSRINNLRILSLSDNPLICTCDTLWLVKVLKFRHVNLPDKMYRISPFTEEYGNCSNQKNLPIIETNSSILHCNSAQIQSLKVEYMSNQCDAKMYCIANKPAIIKWQQIDNKMNKIIHNDTIKKSQATIYIKNLSEKKTYRCIVDAKSVADISLPRCNNTYSKNNQIGTSAAMGMGFCSLFMIMTMIIAVPIHRYRKKSQPAVHEQPRIIPYYQSQATRVTLPPPPPTPPPISQYDYVTTVPIISL
jgi:hypothetical protein